MTAIRTTRRDPRLRDRTDGRVRPDLTVVPPGTTPAPAGHAPTAATGRAHHDEPTALPAGLSAPADGQPSA